MSCEIQVRFYVLEDFGSKCLKKVRPRVFSCLLLTKDFYKTAYILEVYVCTISSPLMSWKNNCSKICLYWKYLFSITLKSVHLIFAPTQNFWSYENTFSVLLILGSLKLRRRSYLSFEIAIDSFHCFARFVEKLLFFLFLLSFVFRHVAVISKADARDKINRGHNYSPAELIELFARND